MSQINVVAEYEEEGLAVLEDSKGQFLMTKKSSTPIALKDYEAYVGKRTPCYLLQSREAMLT